MQGTADVVGSAASVPRTQRSATRFHTLSNRYRDAYRMATVVVGFGSFVKIVAAVGGVVIALVGLRRSDYMGGAAEGILAMFLGGLFWFCGFIWGVLISVVGQTLRASLDCAVNGSPFLAHDEKASIIGV